MNLKISIIPYMGICLWAKLSHFSTNRAEICYGNSGDYYLVIYRLVVRKHVFDAILKIYFWWEMGVATKGSGISRPDQKVDQMGGPVGSTFISKKCFRNFRA